MARKLSAASIAKIEAEINLRARVKRPNIVQFFLTGEFDKLPKVKSTIIDSPITRAIGRDSGDIVGWSVPESDLGRVGMATPSVAESVRAWIKKSLGSYVDESKVSVLCEGDEIVIYHKE